MEVLGDAGHVESRLVHLGTMLVLVQNSCTFCTERNKGLETILDAPCGTPR
jgi:hypothetical protein